MCVVQLIDDGNHAFAARIAGRFAAGELTHDFFANRPALKFDPFPFYKKGCRFPPTCRSHMERSPTPDSNCRKALSIS